MDCPCEENLIRMKLSELTGIRHLCFNLNDRTLEVIHDDLCGDMILEALQSLNLGASFFGSKLVDGSEITDNDNLQRKTLKLVLVINLLFFCVEIITGFLSRSMGLVADSLDMLSDALVYGMSLFAVGAAIRIKKRVAFGSGLLQLLLAFAGLVEVVRRFIGIEQTPDFRTMIFISILALMANAACLWLLQRTKSNDPHIRASLIFSANDVIVNLGVIGAGVLVGIFNNKIPDLIIGILVFMIVIRGALQIFRLARS